MKLSGITILMTVLILFACNQSGVEKVNAAVDTPAETTTKKNQPKGNSMAMFSANYWASLKGSLNLNEDQVKKMKTIVSEHSSEAKKIQQIEDPTEQSEAKNANNRKKNQALRKLLGKEQYSKMVAFNKQWRADLQKAKEGKKQEPVNS